MGLLDHKKVKTGGFYHQDAVDTIKEGKTSESTVYSIPDTTGPTGSPMFGADSQVVVHYFEIGCSQWAEEDYSWAPTYRDVYGTKNFSRRVREQMDAYPGMHNTDMGPKDPRAEDPWAKAGKDMGTYNMSYWNAAMDNPESFMAGLQQRQGSFDYTEMFRSKDDFKKNAAALITECIPCFDRLFDGAQLLPDANLLEVHLLNINLKTDLIDKLKELFADPGFNIDLCELLKLFSHLCPQDLLAILAVLSQYLAKLNLDFKFNLDLIIELVGPILSPFLDALGQWLDKWIQMILAPIICVVDHINMMMYMAQQIKMPLSEASVNLDWETGVAAPHLVGGNINTPWYKAKNEQLSSHRKTEGGLHFGFDGEGDGLFDPYASGMYDHQAFDTPDSQLYNPSLPEVPKEEWEYSFAQLESNYGEGHFSKKTGYGDLTEEEKRAAFLELQSRRKRREIDKGNSVPGVTPAPLRRPRADGSLWSPDNIPMSEKKGVSGGFSKGQVPPNKQGPKSGVEYADEYTYLSADKIVDPIIQMRNILQGGIAYIQDWFDYVVQLIYDLLGTDYGWMKKKLDQTVLKSRIIQLIYMIVAIIDAFMNTDLKCGTGTNLNPAHMDYMIGTVMNRLSPFKFVKRPDGTFEVIPPGTSRSQRDPQDLTQKTKALADEGKARRPEQIAAESGIIIKDCLRKVSASDLARVRQWIRDFERRSGTNAS